MLRRFREKIRRRQYVISIHAEEEMDDDELTIRDIESSILTGRIVERQRDVRTRKWKYVVLGAGLDGSPVGIVGKLSTTGRLVIMTTYRE